jgi:hypothetical protein
MLAVAVGVLMFLTVLAQKAQAVLEAVVMEVVTG